MKKQILIADPRTAFREELRAMFIRPPEEEQIHEAATDQELLDELAKHAFDLVIVNQSLVTDSTILPRNNYMILAPQLDMLMLFAARTQGARAYLQENASVSLIRQVAELPQGIFLTDPAISAQIADYMAHHALFSIHDEGLTTREREVFHLLLNGQRKQDIAGQLHISVNTIKAHTRSIYNKLNLNRYRMEIFSIFHDPDTKDQ
jgi:two-component system invasion response regulator UvrY